MRARRAHLASAIALGCIASLCILSSCRAIVGNYEVGPTHDAAAADDAKTDSGGAIDSTPAGDAPIDAPGDAGPLASCNAYFLAGSHSNGIYNLAAKEGPVHVFCDMTKDGGGWTLVAIRSASTSSTAWRAESAVTKTLELVDPATPGDLVLAIDWTQLAFTQVIYDLGPPSSPTRALFPLLTSTEISGARGALSALPLPGDKPKCVIDGIEYPACSPRPPDGGGPPPGDPGKGLGWLFSPTGVSCWWAWDTAVGAQECTSGKPGPGHVWVK